jgi:REP element-mobilizing transposase RayT
LEDFQRDLLTEPAYRLDHRQREVVRDAIASVCQYRGWQLIALHVRFDHVHVVVDLDREPDNAWRDFKAYATRLLRESGLDV